MSAAADPKGAETAVQKSLMFLLQYITILLTGQGSFSCFSKFFSVFFRQNRLSEPLPLMKRPAGCFSSRPTRRRAAKERQNRAGFPWTDRAAAPTARVIRKGCAWQNRTAFRSPGLCICTRRTLIAAATAFFRGRVGGLRRSAPTVRAPEFHRRTVCPARPFFAVPRPSFSFSGMFHVKHFLFAGYAAAALSASRRAFPGSAQPGARPHPKGFQLRHAAYPPPVRRTPAPGGGSGDGRAG